MKSLLISTMLALMALQMRAQSVPSAPQGAEVTTQRIDSEWRFSLGHATDREKDFHHGTEYFTYYTKAYSNNDTKAPVTTAYDDTSWQQVTLPHDWVVDLPYAGEASHSHGYKCIGWRYPENSVGWYRRHLYVSPEERGKQVMVEFEGIFRQSQVFCNGAYLGSQQSGYVSSTYDLTPYIRYGEDNVIAVRVDASIEEGWYYEGAGIYRHVNLYKTGPVCLKPYSLCIDNGDVTFETICKGDERLVSSRITIFDREGNVDTDPSHPWSLDDPYLYTARIELFYDGRLSATYDRRFGLRHIDYDAQRGFLLNGQKVVMKGCNLHLDAAGVGTAMPDHLWRYRIAKLKEWGFNAIRCSHNPASPAMLDICDEMGMLVIDENRQFGVNDEQTAQLRHMVMRDRCHPSVVLWSIGNEEWAVEWNEHGERIAREMARQVRQIDPTRPVTYASSSGPWPNKPMDVFGFNYIIQNDIKALRTSVPGHTGVGTEETSGCGTRGKYQTVAEKGWMESFNRQGVEDKPLGGEPRPEEGYRIKDGRVMNVIERGWRYYATHPDLCGLYYWTGFDYRGESNPMVWPATGSQFGILDYCGFPKDEAFYLKSQWTDEPMLYLSPHWNAPVAPGDSIEVWAYTNCSEVSLSVNGRKMGIQKVPAHGHVAWQTIYRPGRLVATGLYKGKKIRTEVATTGMPATVSIQRSKQTLLTDGEDIMVADIEVRDAKGRIVPDADVPLTITIRGASLLGWGNGDPGFKHTERPAALTCENAHDFPIHTFSGRAQLIIRSIKGGMSEPQITVSLVKGEKRGVKGTNVLLQCLH